MVTGGCTDPGVHNQTMFSSEFHVPMERILDSHPVNGDLAEKLQ